MKKGKIAIILAILVIMTPIVHAQALQGPDDTTPPNITEVLLTHGPTTLVTWTTNEAANSKIQYGKTTDINESTIKADLETAHSQTLPTIPGNTYYYKITSCDFKNNCKSTTIENFVAGPFYVKAEIPRYSRTALIDIPGTTRPGAEVAILVNNVETRKATIPDGTFLFRSVQLTQTNNITIKAVKGTETAEAKYQVDVDNKPPIINITIPAVVTTQSVTANVKISEPVTLTIEHANKTTNITTNGTTDVKIDNLQPGENIITFTAQDKAGFKSIAEERTIYDTGPPNFINTNLNQLSPSYKQQIDAKGQVSENASITVFVNGKPQNTEPTSQDGTFSIPFKLERQINYSTEPRTSLDTGVSWKNKVRLEAVDAAGQKKSTEEIEIAYALCGEGTWIDVQLTNPMPDILNPRMLLEGLQQIGIAFNYTYRGNYKATINPAEIKIKSLTFAPEFQKEYDNKLVTVTKPPVRTQKSTKPSGLGYIQINFNPIDPWIIEGETAPDNSTMYEKEEKLSKHREGECIVPGFGCMKLFLELEIPFIEEIPTTGYLPTTTPMGGVKTEQRTQKTCINVEVAIDKRIPPKYIPTNFLNATSKFLGQVMDNIDKVLKPVETIGQYLMYTCMAGTLLSYVPILLETYNCKYKKVSSAVGGKGGFNEEVAAIDACTEEYGDNESGDNCETCSYWKDKRQKYERLYRQVCDRVMCPAAPSLQYYLKTKGRQTPTKVNAPNAQAAMSAYTQTTGELLSGSSCAAWMQVNRKKDAQVQPRMLFTSEEIQGIYQKWLDHKGDSSSDKSTGKINCAGLHPAHPDCCGYEYVQEWSSSCGISLLGTGLDTFNEIKESTCLSMRGVGKNEIPITGGTTGCNKLLNSLSGFCTKDGGEPITTIPAVKMTEAKAESLGVLSSAETRDLYIVVQEQSTAGGLGLLSVGQSKGYSIKLGIIVKKLEFERGKGETLATSETSRLTEKLDIVEYPGAMGFQQTYFNQQAIDNFRKGGHAPPNFKSALCEYAGNPPCNMNEDSVYGQAVAAMGSPDKEYIIKPNEGFLNSVRCICFPTIIGYLRLWKKIIGAVQNCVNTILITGDGSTGVCQAVISKYACDLLYEILACFTQSFSSGNARIDVGGIGDVLGALTTAGTEMSRSVESRYGETGTYKAVFVEKKLVHSICMWAFTGTWDFDVAAAFDQSIEEIPIESYSLTYPCERRFIAFNPSTRPGGLVTWVYHVGVGYAAGADSQIELHLKCSGGYKCRDIDGFEKGKCDCDTEKDITILPEGLSTNVKKNDILSQELFYTMAGTPGEGAIRYDKAYLVYKYQDAGKEVVKKSDECTINLVGGTSSVPAFCRYEPFTLSFRCQFGEAEGALRFIRANANYKVSVPAGKTFTLADNVNITLDIQQDHPGKEKNNKYLQYEVINSAGTTVADNKNSLFMLATNGDYQKNIGITPAIIVKKNWFETTSTATWKAQQWSTKNPNAITENTMIEDITFLTPTGVTSTEVNKPFAMSLKYVSGRRVATIHQASTTPQLTSAGIATGLPIEGCQDKPAEKEVVCVPGGTLPAFGGTLTIRLTDNPVGKDETIHSHFIWKPAAATDPCSPPADQRPIVPLKIKFTAYDADQYGQPTDQVTIDPMSAQEAIFEMPFNAICATEDEIKAFSIKIVVAADEIKKITDLINIMNTAETKQKEGLSKLTGPVDSLSKAGIISDYMTIMIAEEQTHLDNINSQIQTINDPQYAAINEALGKIKTGITDTITQAKYIKTKIDEQIRKTTTPDLTIITELVQQELPILNTKIETAINAKKTALSILQKEIKTPTTINCPTTLTQLEDGYYVCADKGTKTTPWQEDTSKPCYGLTTQVCYKLPEKYYCDKTEYGYKYECKTKGACTNTELFLYCPQDLTCCKTSVLAELHPLEKGLNDIRTYLEQIKTLPTEVTTLTNLQKANDNEYLAKKEELIKTFKDLSDKLAQQAQEVESKYNAVAGVDQKGFPGNQEKAIQALGLVFTLKTSIKAAAQVNINRMNNVPRASIQELRQSVDFSIIGFEDLVKKEEEIIKLINEAIGISLSEKQAAPTVETPPSTGTVPPTAPLSETAKYVLANIDKLYKLPKNHLLSTDKKTIIDNSNPDFFILPTGEDYRPKFYFNETTGFYVYTSSDKKFSWEYNPFTNSIAIYTDIVQANDKAIAVSYYSQLGIAASYDKKDPGFDQALAIHLVTNTVPSKAQLASVLLKLPENYVLSDDGKTITETDAADSYGNKPKYVLNEQTGRYVYISSDNKYSKEYSPYTNSIAFYDGVKQDPQKAQIVTYYNKRGPVNTYRPGNPDFRQALTYHFMTNSDTAGKRLPSYYIYSDDGKTIIDNSNPDFYIVYGEDRRPRFTLNEQGRYVYKAPGNAYIWEYNPATNSIATYTGVVPEESKATMVDYYSEIGIATMFEKKDPGFTEALNKHMTTNPKPAATIELLCGNGIVDEGEVCDINKTTGFPITIHRPNEWISYNDKTNLVQWVVLGMPTSTIYGEKNINDFCKNTAGSDCTDKVTYEEKGYCSSDCKEFKPLIVCQDDDWMPFADTGMGTYLGPRFYLENGVRKMQDTYDYLYSDMDKKNPCAPAGVTPLGKGMLDWK